MWHKVPTLAIIGKDLLSFRLNSHIYSACQPCNKLQPAEQKHAIFANTSWKAEEEKQKVKSLTYNITSKDINICIITVFCIIMQVGFIAQSNLFWYIQFLDHIGLPLVHIDRTFIYLNKRNHGEELEQKECWIYS